MRVCKSWRDVGFQGVRFTICANRYRGPDPAFGALGFGGLGLGLVGGSTTLPPNQQKYQIELRPLEERFAGREGTGNSPSLIFWIISKACIMV